MSFKIDEDYIDVAQRIVEFRTKFPDGSLQQVSYELATVGDRQFVIYTAAAYRTPDDLRPGHGTAWEPVPGPTSFTRDSEMQNAETAAWGRAIVAVLAADTKRGVASAQEVRNRMAPEQPVDDPKPATTRMGRSTPAAVTKAQLTKIGAQMGDLGMTDRPTALAYVADVIGRPIESRNDLTPAEAHKLIDALDKDLAEPFPEAAS